MNNKDKFVISRYCKGIFIDLDTSFSHIVSRLDDVSKKQKPLTIFDLVHIYNACEKIDITLYNLNCYINIDKVHIYRDTTINNFLITEGIVNENDLDILKIFKEKIEAYNHVLSLENSLTTASDKYFSNLIYKIFHGDSNGYCLNSCIRLVTDIVNKLEEKIDEIAKTIEVAVKNTETE